jgi:hypothetical integral membrane protein (TIGR02206 family)
MAASQRWQKSAMELTPQPLVDLAMPRPFQPFTAEHFIALAIGAVAMAAFLMAGTRGGSSRHRATRLLAILNLSVYPLSTLAWMTVDTENSIDNLLPFHLCDLTALAAGFALLTRRPWLGTITYFWGLAATAQALLTPAITVGFPALPFVMFFIHHFAVVIAALYLPLALGWRPKSPWWRSATEMVGLSVIYLFFAMGINRLLGSNFAFVSRPPDNPSLIGHLGPWPWYIVSLLGIAMAMYLLLALPFASRKRSN